MEKKIFLKGRWIMHEFILNNEVIHSIVSRIEKSDDVEALDDWIIW